MTRRVVRVTSSSVGDLALVLDDRRCATATSVRRRERVIAVGVEPDDVIIACRRRSRRARTRARARQPAPPDSREGDALIVRYSEPIAALCERAASAGSGLARVLAEPFVAPAAPHEHAS
jgi:hypothetical protein